MYTNESKIKVGSTISWEKYYSDKLTSYKNKIFALIEKEKEKLTSNPGILQRHLYDIEKKNRINPNELTDKIHSQLEEIAVATIKGFRQKTPTVTSIISICPSAWDQLPYLNKLKLIYS